MACNITYSFAEEKSSLLISRESLAFNNGIGIPSQNTLGPPFPFSTIVMNFICDKNFRISGESKATISMRTMVGVSSSCAAEQFYEKSTEFNAYL